MLENCRKNTRTYKLNSIGRKTICSRRYAFWKYSCRQRGLVFTDFDECGFGYKEFDIGVPRLHLIASGQLEEAWGTS